MKPQSLVRNIMTVGGWTLISRGTGFARDVMMAAYLGTGPVAEAFLIAFSLPNMFRRFFAEGAFNMAFVPMFAKKLEGGEDAAGFARDAWNGMVTLLLAFTVIGTLAMPWLVWAMASGFSGERFDLAVTFGQISFSYILFISLVALLSGILTTHGRFSEASFVPVLMNLVFIAAMGLAVWAGWDMGLTLSWTVPITGVAQLAFTWVAARKIGYAFTFGLPRWTADLARLALIAGPAVLAGGVVQINLLVGRQVASFTEGAVAWLSYADRLYQLPLGVVGIAIGTVLLPDLSRRMGPEARFDARFMQRLPRIVAACVIMGGVLWAAAWALTPALHLPLWRYLALTALCALGIAAYFGAGTALGAFKLKDFAALRRRV